MVLFSQRAGGASGKGGMGRDGGGGGGSWLPGRGGEGGAGHVWEMSKVKNYAGPYVKFNKADH